jgi:hypothetical protein
VSRTINIPDDFDPDDERDQDPAWAFSGGDDDERDVLLPVGYDEHGNAIYAPRGYRFRLSGWE